MCLFVLLLLLGCQPYVDSEQVEFTSQIAGFGPKRQLELIALQSEPSSLLLVFNQPLRSLESTDLTAPFEVSVHPPVPISSTALEGVAGVRVTFSQPLAFASTYTVEVPCGWRSMTGVALVAPIRRRWSTPRPELASVSVVGQPASPPGAPLRLAHGDSLELGFNQPVAFGSVRGALSLVRLEAGGAPVRWELEPVETEQGGKDHTRFVLNPGLLEENVTYKLALAPGVKGLEGPLRGNRAQHVLVDSYRPLRYLGSATLAAAGLVELEFSAPVSPGELLRCLSTAPSAARPASVTVDPKNPRRLRLRFDAPFPRRLFLVGLESQEGPRLEQPVSIELEASAAGIEEPPGPMVPLVLSGRGLSGLSAGRISSWKLSLEQAIAASVAAPRVWEGKGSAFWERGKPVLVGKALAPAKVTQVLPGKGPVPPSFLAVRWQGRTSVLRGLAVATGLQLGAASTAQGVRVKVRRRSDGAAQPGCEVYLRGAPTGSDLGRRLKTDAHGEALLPWGPSKARPEPLFVVARMGKDQTFLPIQPPAELPAPLASTFLVTDQAFYAPEQEILISGFRWKKTGEASTARLSLLPFDSAAALATVKASVDENGMLEARTQAPLQPGQYRLLLEDEQAGASMTSFRVCPVAQDGEAYSLEAAEEQGAWVGKLSREGARHRKAGLRCYLRPLPGQVGEVEGWTRLMGQQPSWEALGSTTTESELRLTVPSRDGVLVWEAFDLDEPSLVLARTSYELESSAPVLSLRFEPMVTGPGQQTVSPVVEGEGAEGAELSAALMMRAPGGDWQELETRPQLRGPWALRYREAGTYRILLRAVLAGGQVLGSAWERQISPSELADPGLAVEPKVAMPGAALTPSLAPASAGEQVWLQLTGGGEETGQFAVVGADGTLPPLTVGVARSMALLVQTVQLSPLHWGEQRGRAVVRTTPVPLGPLSRRADLTLTVTREDGVNAAPQAGQDLRLTVQRMGPGNGWTGFALVSPVLEGWPRPAPPLLESFLGRTPAPEPDPQSYPLLPKDFAEGASEIRHGLSLEPESQLTLPGPGRPGSYRWSVFGRDDAGRFAWSQTTVEIGEISRWDSFLPWGARAGDDFEAGIVFASGPKETSPIGLTATALTGDGRLAPSGYLRTAGVAKPGDSCMLPFHYRLGVDASTSEELGWALGHGGQKHEQQARLKVFQTPSVPRGGAVAVLQSGARRRLPVKGPQPWRLFLNPPEKGQEAHISVYGPTGSLGKMHLKPGAPHLELQGGGPGTVTIVHEGGSPITYQMFRLQPDAGETTPWGARLYLFRQLIDEGGDPVSSVTVGEPARVIIDLVNPAPLDTVNLRLPLPGGLRPVELRATRQGTPEPVWSSGPGRVDFELTSLPAGEFVWELEVAPEVAGDYLWPTAQVTARGGLQALSGSGRVRVVR